MRGRKTTEGKKCSLYFPEELIVEICAEGARLERSVCWVVQQCVNRGGLNAVRAMPATDVGSEAAE